MASVHFVSLETDHPKFTANYTTVKTMTRARVKPEASNKR
jgi:hypothetical protein